MKDLIQPFPNLFCMYSKVFQPECHLIPYRILGTGELVEWILEDQSDFFTKLCGWRSSGQYTVDGHFTAVSALIELRNQPAKCLAERAFPGTVFSDNSNKFPFFCRKRNIIQRQLFCMGIPIFQMFYF